MHLVLYAAHDPLVGHPTVLGRTGAYIRVLFFPESFRRVLPYRSRLNMPSRTYIRHFLRRSFPKLTKEKIPEFKSPPTELRGVAAQVRLVGALVRGSCFRPVSEVFQTYS